MGQLMGPSASSDCSVGEGSGERVEKAEKRWVGAVGSKGKAVEEAERWECGWSGGDSIGRGAGGLAGGESAMKEQQWCGEKSNTAPRGLC